MGKNEQRFGEQWRLNGLRDLSTPLISMTLFQQCKISSSYYPVASFQEDRLVGKYQNMSDHPSLHFLEVLNGIIGVYPSREMLKHLLDALEVHLLLLFKALCHARVRQLCDLGKSKKRERTRHGAEVQVDEPAKAGESTREAEGMSMPKMLGRRGRTPRKLSLVRPVFESGALL